MVERQFTGRIMIAAILTDIFIPCKYVATVEFNGITRKPIIKQKPDYTGNRYMKTDRGNPVVAVALEITSDLTLFTPALKIII